MQLKIDAQMKGNLVFNFRSVIVQLLFSTKMFLLVIILSL